MPDGGAGEPGCPGLGLSEHYPLQSLPSVVFLVPFIIPRLYGFSDPSLYSLLISSCDNILS